MALQAFAEPVFRSEDYRDVALMDLTVNTHEHDDGTIYIQPEAELGPYPGKLTERLDHWARQAPQRTFIAMRDPEKGGAWRELSYGRTRALVRSLAQALIDRGLSPERPVAILSGNDIEHALLGLACLYAGIPYAPISPAYSTLSTDHAKLKHIIGLLTPGLIFASDGETFARAFQTLASDDREFVVTRKGDEKTTLFETLTETPETLDVDRAHEAVGPDTIAKFLFTSGSTGLPKGVINTQRMICANQVMLNTVLQFLKEEPPVIVDWLPWNHTFGGNHNVGLVLFNGGTLYIDEGKPMPGGIEETVRNLREISPTVYFNVPKGYEALIPYLKTEPDLRKRFFARLKLTFFAGAGLAQPVWDEFDRIAIGETGKKIVMLTGLGATESAPFALSCSPETTASGHVGVPVPGLELKLAPVDGKMEARLKGPNITPGYWRDEKNTAKAFDEEGYYKLGDALKFIDRSRPNLGFLFDGRVAEDFKLATGTWVSVGPLRARFLDHFAPFARDVVIAGLNRDDVTAMVFPDLGACRTLVPDLGSEARPAALLRHPALRTMLKERLDAMAREATGSSTRICRLLVLEEPPCIDAGEVTDKGSINQRAVLARRAELVERLYDVACPPDIIEID
ncbi:feruloyl-CoA synthase [Breoghania sp.]|uniref:feruloyl-CoA synthase n=1 Tax=Breoghania sp. TaxID=2065378 RepID=UPI002AAAEEF9|nr:feruloyl-CoA synthase [Breoghania sp.]